jgi:hypothetical protein
MISGSTGIIYLVGLEWNDQSGFPRSEPPAPTEGATLTASENDKARTCLSLDRFLKHVCVPCLLVA